MCASEPSTQKLPTAFFMFIESTLNGNNDFQFSESLPYKISAKPVEGFLGYIEKSSCFLVSTRLYYNSVRLDMVTVRSLKEF